jgi:chromosomal replication initiation ATPase DnaA
MAEKGLRLPDEAVGMMARELTGNIRHLEGKVSRLAALMRIEGMEPTTSCIRMALEVSTPGAKRSALMLQDVVGAVAEEYGLTPGAVLGRGRAAVLRRARQVAVVLCRKLLGARYVELGLAFGGRSHATIVAMTKGIPAGAFSAGLEGRQVERILFRLGVTMKPEEILERQRSLFDGETLG